MSDLFQFRRRRTPGYEAYGASYERIIDAMRDHLREEGVLGLGIVVADALADLLKDESVPARDREQLERLYLAFDRAVEHEQNV